MPAVVVDRVGYDRLLDDYYVSLKELTRILPHILKGEYNNLTTIRNRSKVIHEIAKILRLHNGSEADGRQQ